MSEGEPALKCVVAWSDRRNLCSLVPEELEARVGSSDLIRLGDDAIVVYCTDSPEQLRDLVAIFIDPEESVIVFEFEKWSGRGPGVNAEWLMRRGH
jgi:hypothetical protein